jgi:outer membrane protein assembly factor BamB
MSRAGYRPKPLMQTRRSWFLTMLTAAPLAAADWPDFRGPNRDGIYPDSDIASTFPAGGPPLLWEKQIGAGFANPVVSTGRLILFHRRGDEEIVEALEAETGAPEWRFAYPTRYHDDFGFDEGPRASPVAVAGQVYTFGAEGTLSCVSFATGAKIWQRNVNQEFAVNKGFFGAASTPLVDGRRVYLNVGGADGAGIVAFDKDTGRTLWQTGDDEASYSSPIEAPIDGKDRLVFFTREGLLILEPADGAIVDQHRWRSRSRSSVNAAMPVVAGDIVFLTASYGTGAICLQRIDGAFKELWSGEDSLAAHYATPVHKDGVLYGFHGRQEYGQEFRAVELRTGKVFWTQPGFGAGTVLLAGDQLVILREDGELVLAEASPTAYRERARAQVLSGQTRPYAALADGRLYARDISRLAALDLRKS